jgi:hypothetical protein
VVAERGLDSADGAGSGAASPLLVLAPGRYTLDVFGAAAATGDYALRLLDVAAAPLLAKNVPVEGVLDPANATQLYRIEGLAGERFYLDVLTKLLADHQARYGELR